MVKLRPEDQRGEFGRRKNLAKNQKHVVVGQIRHCEERSGGEREGVFQLLTSKLVENLLRKVNL